MRPTTIAIQFICVAVGALFMYVGLLGTSQVFIGGLLFGSVFFLGAAILGADHTTNPNAPSRLAFKVFAVIVALPIMVIAGRGLFGLWVQEKWLYVFITFTQLVIVVASILGIAFEHYPAVNRFIKRLGFSASQL